MIIFIYSIINYRLLYKYCRFKNILFFTLQVAKMKELHQKACPRFHPSVVFSFDGIQESKSSGLSADVYTISFHQCRTVYPVKIIRQFNKFRVDDQDHIKEVIDDINCSGCKILKCICDNPKRSILKCSLCHSSYYACEYCESKAAVKKTDTNKKGNLTWPSSTNNGKPRTVDSIKDIANKIEFSNQPLSRDECKGVTGTSHLLYQPNFHFINDNPAEYMHSGCLGAVRRLVELTFDVGEVRERVTKRKLSQAIMFNKLILLIQVPREFNRRCRNLDFGVLKAQEFRNIILFFFPIVIECIPKECKNERKLWLYLAYIFRACVLPNDEFMYISKPKIKKAGNIFYQLFESIHGEINCTYSIHMIGGHILDIRGDQPLTDTSAFLFENFYAEMKTLFQPGTTSPSKQIIENCYMKRQLEDHSCFRHIHFDIEKKGKENNHVIYVINETNEYEFFKIIKINDDETFTCYRQGRSIFKCDITDINWETVGVFKVGPYTDDEEIIIRKKDVKGKVIKVHSYFITCPINVLREQ